MSGADELNINKLFAMKTPCKNCPFLKKHGIPLKEGRLQGIKDELLADDTVPFFCHKTTFETGGAYDDSDRYQPSGKESYCMGAMAYLYAKRRLNVPTRMGIMMGLCDLKDIESSVSFIEID